MTMKTQDSARLLTTIAPVAIAVPPLAILATVLSVGLLWLLSDEERKPTQKRAMDEDSPPAPKPAAKAQARKVTREDLAEALAYGGRPFTRKEAVEALEALGFRKTAAYKAMAADGKFASMLAFSPDGVVE